MNNNDLSVANPRPAPSSIFSRLRGLWSSPVPAHTPKDSLPLAIPIQNANISHARFLKIRIVTWNMHDSLPKGDLEELLGKVPPYNNLNGPSSTKFPVFPNDGSHPYHLVVIAGQECPTSSGMPMGLGAGFKWHGGEKEKEKDKGKGKGKRRGDEKETEKEKEKEKEKEREGPREKGKDFDKFFERSESRKDKEKSKMKDIPGEHNSYSWTSMVEDWLCNGGGYGPRNGTPTIADIGAPKPLVRRVPSKEPRRGPYQLLVKERLMGIYLAVYIHLDIRELVQGTSKSAVTAGLIGGRVGNKGGVGISIDLDGTTFLFLNAHLAAHGSRVNDRLANLSKITAELAVDSHLQPDDPRMVAEDLTDKFDFTFIFGDLNFRLDITRLHADWLISRQEYAQALHFDQLTRLMREGKAFVGFSEAQINFPPTFKYDVLRTLRKAKRSEFKRDLAESPVFMSQGKLTQDKVDVEQGVDDDDAVSVLSSSSSSINSKLVGEQEETANYLIPTPVIPKPYAPPSKPSDRARRKWLALLSPLSPGRSPVSSPQGVWSTEVSTARKSAEEIRKFDGSKPPTVQRHSFSTNNNRTLQPPVTFISSKSSLHSDVRIGAQDKGVYDSSHKQRVPSWCDRILWKSTLQPDPEADEPISGISSQSKPGLVQRFANAMRPLARPRSLSQCSTPSAPAGSSGESAHVFTEAPQSAPFSRIVQPLGSPLIARPSHGSLQSPRSKLSDSKGGISKSHSNSVTANPLSNPMCSEELTCRSADSPQRRSSTRESFWWLLPSFLSPSQSPVIPAQEVVSRSTTGPRKGDVVCLTYQTLDDEAMRRLEGRSDHRPIVGTYAVYF